MANGKRTRNLFDPASEEPYKLSRSKLELFLRCPRCFYLDRRCGVGQPPMPAFSLNNAVDALLKREFDEYRRRGEPHRLMRLFGVEAVPFDHPSLDDWRDNRKGIQFLHPETNFLVFGAIDDLWETEEGSLIIVDYKSTSTDGEVTLEGHWKEAYKRQVEVYQWLFRQNGFDVSNTAYFVYVNADKTKSSFDGKLEFTTRLLPHEGDASWISEALEEAHLCLCRKTLPLAHPDCEWCNYRKAAKEADL
jgi:hypothetical protein